MTETARKPAERRLLPPAAHKLLWLCLLGLSMAIVLWPVTPSPIDPLPVQPIYAIHNLPWFIALFYAWATVLAALLFLVKGSIWECLGLCLIFTVVFIQFWGFVFAPWGNSGDSSWLMAHVKYLQQTGKFPPGGYHLGYFGFPGFILLTTALLQTIGVDLFMAARLYLMASGLLFTLILYVAFLTLLRTPSRAAMGVVLAVVSSQGLGVISNQFHAVNLATIHIVTFILLLARQGMEGFLDLKTSSLFVILIAAATISYTFSPVLFSMVLLGGYVLHRVVKAPTYLSVTFAVFPLILFISWEVYATFNAFDIIVIQAPLAIAGLLDGTWLGPTRMVLGRNVGSTLPWWGNTAKLFWWLSVFGFGSLLMLWRLRSFGKTDKLHRVELAIFVGTLITVSFGILAGGSIGVVHGGLTRYIWIAPLFLAPVLVDVLARPRVRTIAVAFVAAAILLLPATFFTNAHSLSTSRNYREEMAWGEFLAASYPEGKGLTLYAMASKPTVYFVYIRDARVGIGTPQGGYAAKKSETVVFRDLQFLVSIFHGILFDETPNKDNHLLVVTTKTKVEYQAFDGIRLESPNWRALESQLSETTRIYDSGFLQLHAP